MGSFKDSENFRLSRHFPALIDHPLAKTSAASDVYNCYAYAAGDTRRNWAPLPIPVRGVYWPVAVREDEEDTVWPVLRGYEAVGFELCDDGSLEAGREKIAIYVDEHEAPTHVAVQRDNGIWQSKLGPDIDVEHGLESLQSSSHGTSAYGRVKYFMARPRVER